MKRTFGGGGGGVASTVAGGDVRLYHFVPPGKTTSWALCRIPVRPFDYIVKAGQERHPKLVIGDCHGAIFGRSRGSIRKLLFSSSDIPNFENEDTRKLNKIRSEKEHNHEKTECA